jgi:hypothetical protein
MNHSKAWDPLTLGSVLITLYDVSQMKQARRRAWTKASNEVVLMVLVSVQIQTED